MCGISGYVTAQADQRIGNYVRSMNDTLVHRGPDSGGVYTYQNQCVGLGQRRLSIIDLSIAGHQPMWYHQDHGAFSEQYHSDLFEQYHSELPCIVFNGEIYNFLLLKETLSQHGYVFSTGCDTEVILAAYDHRGYDAVKHFNGMRSFAIYDPRKDILFFSRDVSGKKPLYYYLHDGVLAFASELKALVALEHLSINTSSNLNADAIEYYFSLGYIPAPDTIYKHVYKLESRQSMIFDRKKFIIEDTHYYYELPDYSPNYDRASLIKKGKELLADAVALRMVADVPVGTFLSGGLDSSAVTAQMKALFAGSELHTFSIGFEGKKYDETPYITKAKDYIGTQHHHYYFRKHDFEGLLGQFALSYDEPFWDYSGFPTHKVCQMAREHVTVVLSGDGGDEIFAGYNSHLAGRRMDLIYRMPRILRKLIARIPAKQNLNGFASWYLFREACKVSLSDKSQFYAKALSGVGIKTDLYQQITTEWLEYALAKGGNYLGEALRIYDLLFNTLANNFLVKVDRASMAYAVEVRCPFLDKRFLDFAQTIPVSYKIGPFQTKKIMRDIIKDLLPREIVYRGKQGFSPPLPEWINSGDYEDQIQHGLDALQKLHSDLAAFYTETVMPDRNNALYTNYVIRLFLFGLWYKKWID